MSRRVVIFGGTGGLGSQLTPNLIDKGYDVMPLGSNDVDITCFREVQQFFLENEVDIVINMSAYNYNLLLHKYKKDNDGDVWEQIKVNIEGALNILANCLPQMRDRGYGRIILMSSILSSRPVPGTAVYSGCKAFIDNLVKTCSVENLSKGVTCNSLQLGYFDGGLVHRVPEPMKTQVQEEIPLKRWGSIDELTNAVEYLINTEYSSGTNLKLNGGLLA